MNYKKIYDSIIQRASTRVLSGYVERHHIIPRCLGGLDTLENICVLTAEEHFICHQLLAKMYPHSRGIIISALLLTAHPNGKRSNNKAYGWLKKIASESQTGDNHHLRRNDTARIKNQEYMRGPNNPQRKNPRSGTRHHFFGKHLPADFHSMAAKASISEKNSGNKNAMYGIKPWNHPRSTIETKSVWAIADKCKEWLMTTADKRNMYRMCKALGHLVINPKPHRFGAVMEYLEKGWKPHYDQDWIKL
jgi:hypothetical protein